MPNKNFMFKNLSKKIIILMPLFLILTVAVAFFSGLGEVKDVALFDKNQEELLSEWDSRNYERVIDLSEMILSRDPLNTLALSLEGFSRFYIGISQVNEEDKIRYLNGAIVSLRKSLLVHNNPLYNKVCYVLGKSYYYMGHFYSDISTEYLEKALSSGYDPSDIYEFLGLTYKDLGQYNKSIKFLKKALTYNDTDLLNKALGQALKDNAEYESALNYLDRAVTLSKNDTVKENCLFLQGEIYMGNEDPDSAEQVFKEILEIDNENADAHFYLGEVYQTKNDYIQARAEWRKALRADPYHELASSRLKYR